MHNDERKIVLAIFAVAINSMAAMNITPALAQISQAYQNTAKETIQLLITVPSFAVVFASLCASYAANRLTAKKAILFGSLVFTFAGTVPTFVENFTVLMMSRVLVGLGIGIMMPLVTTIVFDFFTDPTKRNTIMGWQGSAAGAGNVASSLLAGWLGTYSYKAVFLVHLLGLATFFGVLFNLPDTPRRSRGGSHSESGLAEKHRPRPSLKSAAWLVVSFVYTTFVHCFATNLSMRVEEGGIGNSMVAGMAVSMFAVGSMTCGLFYGRLAKATKSYTFSLGVFLSAFGLYALAAAGAPATVYLAGFCVGFGLGMVMPVVVTKVVTGSAARIKTLVISLHTATNNLALSAAPLLVSGVSSVFVGNSIAGRYYVCSFILLAVAASGFVSAVRGTVRAVIYHKGRSRL
ncbi:MAG: MFS transporter [Firmicutes bacterium]|jgi:MFS family permease|nr:MFS transporter [Bacillota bacterium]NLL87747.1 MFS transporter [Bacillota bacterium]